MRVMLVDDTPEALRATGTDNAAADSLKTSLQLAQQLFPKTPQSTLIYKRSSNSGRTCPTR